MSLNRSTSTQAMARRRPSFSALPGEDGELGFELAPVGQPGERVVIGDMLGGRLARFERSRCRDQPARQRRDDQDRDRQADQDQRQHVLHQQQARAARRPAQHAERDAVVGPEREASAPLAARPAEAEIGQQHVAAGGLPIGVVELDERDEEARRRALQAHFDRRRDRHHRGQLAVVADADHRGGAAPVTAVAELALDGVGGRFA